MKINRSIPAVLAALIAATVFLLAAPAEVPLAQIGSAQAAVTTDIGGVEGAGAFTWDINYDDVTRDVVSTASGTGFCYVTIQLTNTISRTVAYYPGSLNIDSLNPDLAARMDAADFRIIADGSTTVLASNVAPASVKRLLGKATSTIGGLQSTVEWSRL